MTFGFAPTPAHGEEETSKKPARNETSLRYIYVQLPQQNVKWTINSKKFLASELLALDSSFAMRATFLLKFKDARSACGRFRSQALRVSLISLLVSWQLKRTNEFSFSLRHTFQWDNWRKCHQSYKKYFCIFLLELSYLIFNCFKPDSNLSDNFLFVAADHQMCRRLR